MNWKFWHRWNRAAQGNPADKKLKGPRDLPSQVGMYLVVKEKLDPDWVWTLRCVERRCHDDVRLKYEFRLYSDTQARQAGVHVVNYYSLDDHPDLILFTGWYYRRTTGIEAGIEIDRGPSTLAA
jgi:hypothetical protein